MTHAAGNPETGGNPRALSRRAVLLILAGSLAPIGSRPLLREARPMDDIILVDGWILRIHDLEGMPTRVG